MTEHVDPTEIERIVGAPRHENLHLGWVDLNGHDPDSHLIQAQVFILHSAACKSYRKDLRECPFSIALDRGAGEWDPDLFERTVVLGIDEYGRLIPRRVYVP